jgi:hypothetical protein
MIEELTDELQNLILVCKHVKHNSGRKQLMRILNISFSNSSSLVSCQVSFPPSYN